MHTKPAISVGNKCLNEINCLFCYLKQCDICEMNLYDLLRKGNVGIHWLGIKIVIIIIYLFFFSLFVRVFVQQFPWVSDRELQPWKNLLECCSLNACPKKADKHYRCCFGSDKNTHRNCLIKSPSANHWCYFGFIRRYPLLWI